MNPKPERIHPLFSGLKPQTGVSESFFDENMELSNLRNQVSELQFSRDSLQEQMTTKDEKIEKLVGHLFSQIQCPFRFLTARILHWENI